MTLTCINNQFDCKAGTKGFVACNSSGKLKPVKAKIHNIRGETRTPIISLLTKFSKIKYINVIAQHKKSKDSYNELNGKCPESIQRVISWIVNNILIVKNP